MYKTYRTTKDTIIAAEIETEDRTFQLLADLDGGEYLLVKREQETAIYHLSPAGCVREIVDDVLFEEYRAITYAKLDKELLAQGIKPKKFNFLKKYWSYGKEN
ncbi:hypothetical protein [Anaerosinus massiliensis]|uniref:hypothetical protein n=1 Tax=Massilibacillus massiliensis TaxID=1806837 RepID=UPI000DA61EAE|nr:hypothetical protein [Massilibacillus massiliensis]